MGTCPLLFLVSDYKIEGINGRNCSRCFSKNMDDPRNAAGNKKF
jgi:hypothetical protein